MFEIGLDISSNKLSAVECIKTTKGVFIKNYGIIDIEPHAITNGELIDSIVLIDGLKDLWKFFKLKKKEVNLGLSNTKLIIKEIELPVTDDKEIENALKYQIEDYFPIAKENLVFDYYIISKTAGSSKIMIIGALKNMIDNYAEAVQSAGLIINSIDLNCFALYRSANYVNNFKSLKLLESGKNICLVYFGQEVSIIEFADENELRYPRFMNDSVNNFAENLGRKLKISNEELLKIVKEFDFKKLMIKEIKKNASPIILQKETANADSVIENNKQEPVLSVDEEFKNIVEEKIYSDIDSPKIDFPDSAPIQANQKEEETAEIKNSLKVSANHLIIEINRSIDHFFQENRNIKLEKILISGEKLINMDKYIEKDLKLPVERIDIEKLIPENIIKNNTELKNEDSSDLSSRLVIACGLALRGIK